MKNKAGFYTTSHNCQEKGGEYAAYKCIPQNKLKLANINPYDLGEWHHASSNRLAFFPKTKEEEAKIDEAIKVINSLKTTDLPKSKAAVWRGLVEQDCGFGFIDYKNGKFGKFKCEFGEPDGTLYYPTEAFAEVAERLLK